MKLTRREFVLLNILINVPLAFTVIIAFLTGLFFDQVVKIYENTQLPTVLVALYGVIFGGLIVAYSIVLSSKDAFSVKFDRFILRGASYGEAILTMIRLSILLIAVNLSGYFLQGEIRSVLIVLQIVGLEFYLLILYILLL